MIHRQGTRDGSVIVCVLVCLLVSITLVTATTQQALRSRREVRMQHQMMQTDLLLDAGVLRAARQIQRSGQYQGETWRPSDSITRFDNAMVEIRVAPVETDADSRSVEVTASLGVAVENAKQVKASLTRRTHTFTFQTSQSTPSIAE